MCTALTLITKDRHHLFGRTLDVTRSYGQSVHIVPRNFNWINMVNQEILTSIYACVGMGIIINNQPCFFDALNEKGLAGAALNFKSYAKFKDSPSPGKNNISASSFLYWALSNFSTVKELRLALKNLVLTNTPITPDLPVAKLHWIFTDLTGGSIVIESMTDGLHIYNNPVGVLTNDPPFSWHLTNLAQYVTLKTETPPPIQMINLLVHPFGQGLGRFGIPGDGSTISRFVRAVFYKNATIDAQDEESGITAFFNLLSQVMIMKGSEESEAGTMDYTAYQSVMCLETGIYYYINYRNQRITAIKLSDLNAKNIISFPYHEKQDILFEN